MNNPFAQTSAIEKIKTKISGKKDINMTTGKIETYLIGINNGIHVAAQACACCWDKPIPDDFAGRAEYVAKRSRIGHTSVLEHTNHIIYMKIDNCYEEDLLSFLSFTNYLQHRAFKSSDGSKWHLIIGGSYRGFADIYKEIDDLNNPILKAITGNLYTYSNSAVFEDICRLGLMNKDQFMNIEPDENFNILAENKREEHELFDIVGVDNISKLYNNLYNIDKDAASKITVFDLIKFATVTIMFKNMSRTCTHQLVRHRNGITQESQRYVDYSKSCFTDPSEIKQDKYDNSHKYRIQFGTSAPMYLTLKEIGNAECAIYEQLRNPIITGNGYALLKEDARAFLPGNVQCRKIYVTFTYKNLIKFLYLREDKAAQAEIRMYANAVGDWFRTNTEFKTKEICDTYIKPRLLVEDPFKIDVVDNIHDEVENLTVGDYIKATGLDND